MIFDGDIITFMNDIDINELDIIIAPCLSACLDGSRLGHGKGYYDRFLKDFSGIKVVCIPDELIVESVFPEKHDIKADIIITSQPCSQLSRLYKD